MSERLAAAQPSRPPTAAPVRHPTRQLTRGPEDWGEPARPADRAPAPDDHQYQPVAGEFAGIAMSEFVWARQHARRMVLIWVAVVLALTGLVATVGWTLGSNLSGLL
jgi:serine/threonine-protein kinase